MFARLPSDPPAAMACNLIQSTLNTFLVQILKLLGALVREFNQMYKAAQVTRTS
jgi:hypothetical protein